MAKEGFEHDGIWITDPTMDETGRFPVDPATYYTERCALCGQDKDSCRCKQVYDF